MARILVIEDNPENLELMVFLLGAFGHTALAARNGEEGLAAALRERPELILCDVHMPRLDGFGVLRSLRADPALRHIPCVAVTALAMLGDRNKMLAAGFDAYLSKPIEPERFATQVRQFLGLAGEAVQAVSESTPTPLLDTPADRHATVLVVDDLSANRELVECTLAPFGYRVVQAHSGELALELAKQQRPDLILSDIHMPGFDGLALLKAFKANPRLADIPFVFVTSSVWGDKHARQALRLGAARFLCRPLEPQALLHEVEALLPARE